MSSDIKNPFVSVVIAVYNGAKTLPATLACLTKQTFRDFEIILVNDESKDDSEKIIHNFSQAHPQITLQYITQKNKGLGGARNTGMRHARGEVISLLDQDDIWYPKKIEEIARVFQQSPEVSFVTHHLQRRVAGQLKDELKCDFMAGNVFHKLLFHGNYFCGSAMSFRKNLLQTLGYFSEGKKEFDLSEDYDYWLRAAAKRYRFHVIPRVLGEYIVHSSNFSKNKLMMFRNEWNIVKEHYQKRPSKHWLDPLCLCKRRGKILAREILARVA